MSADVDARPPICFRSNIMKTVSGDLIKMAQNGDFDVIVHGCNCFNSMGKGIAAGIRMHFPKAYDVDQATNRGNRNKLGTCTYAEDMTDYPGLIVVNAYTQYTFWSAGSDKTDLAEYDAIRDCFRELKGKVAGKSLRLGIPKIGAGLAGGNWDRISAIIEEEMAGEDLTLVLFEG